MSYYNYHAKAKALINGGHLTSYEIVDDWNGIKPALVLHFDNNRSMPIRWYRMEEYVVFIEKCNAIEKEQIEELKNQVFLVEKIMFSFVQK